ncbi:Glutathione transport system permease protein gsiD [Solibacillus isronensis B3W22]|uniref:Glutathione transport system permease protein gsiD n=1 Tax=Solibacillus isronensis B3W22 TaxID=1224748 RepID=K1L4J3_9BACL|nr:ABC transporter permease subunit [Solibacillus isronensis]AMO86665.1 diguanylate cyclase [Solibacillus silvestris]EKB45563.1 Glutathione transport system permease protein gsiD [Solibacillus isronensis B3W22]
MENNVNTVKLNEPVIKAQKNKSRKLWSKLKKNKTAMVGLGILIVYAIILLLGPWLAPYDPYEIDLANKLQSPSMDHLMGTDDKGRDILSRILSGAYLTMGVGIFAVVFGGSVGIILGLVAGYYGGIIDSIISRIIDVMLAFPGILLALAIVSALGTSLINVTLAVGFFSVPMFARIVRGSTMEVKKLEYIDAVRTLGANDLIIIVRHILPNILSPIIIQASMRLATAILSAAGLSFLGLGAQPPSPEWGAMLSTGRDFLFNAPHIALFPGLMISMLVLGLNLLGDGLRDALDPRMKG